MIFIAPIQSEPNNSETHSWEYLSGNYEYAKTPAKYRTFINPYRKHKQKQFNRFNRQLPKNFSNINNEKYGTRNKKNTYTTPSDIKTQELPYMTFPEKTYKNLHEDSINRNTYTCDTSPPSDRTIKTDRIYDAFQDNVPNRLNFKDKKRPRKIINNIHQPYGRVIINSNGDISCGKMSVT